MLKEKPKPGQRIAWRFKSRDCKKEQLKFHAEVLRVEGDLCYVQPDDGPATVFIWRFKKGLNKLVEIVN